MRALLCNEFGSTDNLVVADVDDPVAGEGQVLVAIKAAGINFADVLTVQGKYQVKPPTPFIPGGEAAGVVEAVGPGANKFAVGDEVMIGSSLGVFAEKCAVDEDKVSPMLTGLNFAQAAGFNITYCTTYHAFRQSTQLKAGETLLVLGAAGGVGVAAVELGKAFG
ncbi:MAG: alcohol dehydrogenase catalytic domain-containing protein, partial [Pseudomonadota bacterium]